MSWRPEPICCHDPAAAVAVTVAAGGHRELSRGGPVTRVSSARQGVASGMNSGALEGPEDTAMAGLVGTRPLSAGGSRCWTAH
jgi:hypothetical protein